jgi:hypothetical protein
VKGAIITRNSSLDDIREQLSGTWSSREENGLSVFVTPFFTVITGTMQKGNNILPIKPPSTAMLKWASANSSGNMVVKAGQTTVQVPENCLVELIYWKAPTA